MLRYKDIRKKQKKMSEQQSDLTLPLKPKTSAPIQLNRLESSFCLSPFCQGLLKLPVSLLYSAGWLGASVLPYRWKKTKDHNLLSRQSLSLVSYLTTFGFLGSPH